MNQEIIAPTKNAFQNIDAHQNCSLENAFQNIVVLQNCSLKNAFQNKGTLQNCSLKKYISEHRCTSKLLPQNVHFKTAVFKIFLVKEILTDEHK